MSKNPQEVLRGTLDMLVLRLLTDGPQHGWGISEQIRALSSEVLQVNQGALYPALHRLEKRGLIESYSGRSENNRPAKFYRLTGTGKRQLATEEAGWRRFQDAVNRIMGGADGQELA